MTNPQLQFLHSGVSLPQFYGIDRLVILPRDPYSLFAYWEITESTREKLKSEWGDAAWQQAIFQMRVYKHQWDREEQIESFFDITLQDGSNNWYFNVTDTDRLYHTELGWRTADGNFRPVLRSNLVRTARDSISDIIDEEWQLPDWKARKLYRRISLYHLSSPEMFRRRKL